MTGLGETCTNVGATCTHVGAMHFAVDFMSSNMSKKQLHKRKPIWIVPATKKYHIQLLIK